MTRKLSLRGKHIISLTENVGSCDEDIDLSNKEKLIEIRNILGVEANACDYVPNRGWNMDVIE